MIILLQKNSQPRNKILKTPTTLHTIEGVIYDTLDEKNPIITFDSSYDMTGVNYARINGLSYFVENIDFTDQNKTEVSFKLDVLTSFSTDILRRNAYVMRDSVATDILSDSQLAALATPQKKIKKTFITTIPDDEDNGVYVLSTSANMELANG